MCRLHSHKHFHLQSKTRPLFKQHARKHKASEKRSSQTDWETLKNTKCWFVIKAGRKDPEDDEAHDGNHSTELTVTQSSALNKILERFDSIDTKTKSVRHRLDERTKAQESNVKQLEDKLAKHKTKCLAKQNDVGSLPRDTDRLQARVTFQSWRLTGIEKKVEQLERAQRKNIMFIGGVSDEENATSPDIDLVDDLFQDLKFEFDTHVCD